MRLLVITQVMDMEHPILGFFHRWVEELAKYCEEVQVICLQEGKHQLPVNVFVHSLGKEKGRGRWHILFSFYQLIWRLRKNYDNVFVHMNQIYVLLGALFWRVLSKKVALWYAHGTVSPSLWLATHLTNYIFTSTPEGFRISTKKCVIVGQGIDTGLFTTVIKLSNDKLRLVTVGRVSAAKNIDTLLRACAHLKEQRIRFNFKIVGAATTIAEQEYEKTVKKLALDLKLGSEIEWTGAISNLELPRFLQQSDIFIHDGATNSLDKTLLEAALCGCIVVSSNPAYKTLTETIAPELLFAPKDHVALASILMSKLSHNNSTTVREFIKQKYDISTLAKNIINNY